MLIIAPLKPQQFPQLLTHLSDAQFFWSVLYTAASIIPLKCHIYPVSVLFENSY